MIGTKSAAFMSCVPFVSVQSVRNNSRPHRMVGPMSAGPPRREIFTTNHQPTKFENNWVFPLPHVSRELGCGLPILCSSERISGCMREGTGDVHSGRGCQVSQTLPGSRLQQWGIKSATYFRTHTHVPSWDRTPFFLSRLLTRVLIQSFER